jgi:hypothetical protein
MDVVFFNNSRNVVQPPSNPQNTPVMYSTPEPWGNLSTDYNNTQSIGAEFYWPPTNGETMQPVQQPHEQTETASSEPYKPNFLVMAGIILLIVLLK